LSDNALPSVEIYWRRGHQNPVGYREVLMFALRKINNQYSDFAGTRSDFVVVGHPEFNLGKVPCDNGYGPEWDDRPIPHKLPRSLAADRMRRNGSANHIRRLTEVSPKASYKERALSRSASSTGMKSRTIDRGQLKIADGGSFQSVDEFLADLSSSQQLPPIGQQVTAAGYGNHIRSQPKCLHYRMIQDDLDDIRKRSRSAPNKVREELMQDEAWRYFASHLEQARRREAQSRKDADRKKEKLTAFVRQPSGAVVDPFVDRFQSSTPM